jgi:RsiW-degrading membrane proteinase PrsW (M82 family)
MPVLHVLAAALPGLTYACLAWRGSLLRGLPVRWLTWRQATLAFGLSLGFSAMIAGNVNSLAGLAATVLLLVHNGAFKDALDSHDVFQRIGDAKVILSGNEQWAANLLAIAFAPPFIEEFLKGLSVRFVMRPNFTRAQAFATGAMAGAGFGFLEAMMYGLAGINHDLGSWWLIMLVRAGSTSTHVLNTALVGLAWWYWSIARRNRVAVGLFALAVLDHALWNGFSVTLYSQIWFLDTLSNHALEVAAYSIIAVWSCGIIVAIPAIARRLRDAVPPPVEGTPLASMAPWIA